jgi:hypothetical protein
MVRRRSIQNPSDDRRPNSARRPHAGLQQRASRRLRTSGSLSPRLLAHGYSALLSMRSSSPIRRDHLSTNLLLQGESVALDEVDAEFDEGCSSLPGDGQSAVVLALREPSLVEERGRQRGSERTSQVGAPFAPVETGKRERAPTAAGKSDVDAKPFQSLLAGSSHRIASPRTTSTRCLTSVSVSRTPSRPARWS